MSAPPPASWTAPAPPLNSHPRATTRGRAKVHTGRDSPGPSYRGLERFWSPRCVTLCTLMATNWLSSLGPLSRQEKVQQAKV
jgi:hypothetical protein